MLVVNFEIDFDSSPELKPLSYMAQKLIMMNCIRKLFVAVRHIYGLTQLVGSGLSETQQFLFSIKMWNTEPLLIFTAPEAVLKSNAPGNENNDFGF